MDLFAYAKNIAKRIERQAARTDVPVAVSIIDIHGNIILKHRMNGAPVFAADLSERKAYTSALVGLRTAELFPLVQPGQSLFPLMAVSGGRYCSMGGGAPLTVDGKLIAGRRRQRWHRGTGRRYPGMGTSRACRRKYTGYEA